MGITGHSLVYVATTISFMVPVCSADFVYDFDLMLQHRKEMNRRRHRHRDGGTFISDVDDLISAMVTRMNQAAEVSLFTLFSSQTFGQAILKEAF